MSVQLILHTVWFQLTILAVYFINPATSECHEMFRSQLKKSGTFTSPGFPSHYPELVSCRYIFEAVGDERIKIKFEYFELEGNNDSGCKFDFVDIFGVDHMGFKTLMNRFCGAEKPSPIISIQPKIEMFFKSDYTKSLRGFLGHYEFLDDEWQPFGPPDEICGAEVVHGVGGVITSPHFPAPFPANIQCTWLIKVESQYKILINFVYLDIKNTVYCEEAALAIYDGFADPSTVPAEKICGRLYADHGGQKEFISRSSRITLRFIVGQDNQKKDGGFKLAWSAVKTAEDGPCTGFLCQGSKGCTLSESNECDNIPQYCIDSSLRCNKIPNCAALDNSDEKNCLEEILLITACVVAPLIFVLLLTLIIVYCYRRQHFQKSSSQNQQLTSHLPPLDQSPLSRRHCVMQTSFIDGSQGEDDDGMGSSTEEYCNNPNSKNKAAYQLMKQATISDGRVVVADI
ncbi:tolloid-like protein 1 [Argonauta hians]